MVLLSVKYDNTYITEKKKKTTRQNSMVICGEERWWRKNGYVSEVQR